LQIITNESEVHLAEHSEREQERDSESLC